VLLNQSSELNLRLASDLIQNFMSGIFGIFQRDGLPVTPPALAAMRAAMVDWGSDGGNVWHDGSAGLGQTLFITTPEAQSERLPRIDASSGLAFTAAARVDNRRELISNLALDGRSSVISDGELVLQAYRRWGEDCVARIYGDWSFAAWQSVERKLFLARDHFGNTALYYYADAHIFAFASTRQALLVLNLTPIELDELYLAQLLISWPAYHGERTIHKPIRRLPPAHCLTVTPIRLAVRQYWRLEDTPTLQLRCREDYVEAFREVFDEAVCARLRAPDLDSSAAKKNKIAITLSGGLDSGSVTATAARELRKTSQGLTAFTSVPLFDTCSYVSQDFGDELPFARATAQFAGNVDLQLVTGVELTPIQAIRRFLRINREPVHAAGNAYWLLELEQAAQLQGYRILLTGQLGNAGISWKGDVFSQPLTFQLRQMGWYKWGKEKLKRTMPSGLLIIYQRRRLEQQAWYRSSAIHPDFACRLQLLERRLNDPDERTERTSLEQRSFILPGRSSNGALHARIGAAHGLEIRDPTGDARVLAFTFSVPDHIFIDPATGLNRWLIRAAMKDRLPDEVRLNRRRGRQAGDLVPRLRACAAEVEAVLDELEHGPAAAYVDVAYMRDVWQLIQTQDTPEAYRKSITILTRGVMAGLFVNDFK
jgi:asparagine synthase (glutamine-hydrolysing)